ncbi:MAG: hypothetical protein WCI94_09525 [Rhodospirillales bacterium]
MRSAILIFAMYVLVIGAGYGLNKGWVQLPVAEPSPAPPFDDMKFVLGVRDVGVVVYANSLVPVGGKEVTDIRVRGETYNPSSRTLTVWLSAMARGTAYVFTAECHVAGAGGWFCSRPIDAGGYIRVN